MKNIHNTKLCKNCDFCSDTSNKFIAHAQCLNPKFFTNYKSDLSLVNGSITAKTDIPFCTQARDDKNLCGKEAKGFTPRRLYTKIERSSIAKFVKDLVLILSPSILAILIVILVIANNANATTPSSFHKAKKILYTQIYDNQGKTFYCGCNWSKKKVDLASCDYKIRKNKKRALRTEAEHIVPAYYLAMLTPEGRKCWAEGTKLKGTSGRKYCLATNKKFKKAHNDLMNLVPAIGEINGDRSNYRFAMLQGEPRNYGSCDMEINRKAKKTEPPEHVRGDIARIYFYMRDKYGLQLSKQTTKLMQIWNKQDPMDKVERLRINRIKKYRSNNEFSIK
jgi:deoxyribonuclease-1